MKRAAGIPDGKTGKGGVKTDHSPGHQWSEAFNDFLLGLVARRGLAKTGTLKIDQVGTRIILGVQQQGLSC